MSDAKQTRCPHCGSTFRVSDAQLSAKGGSVRCGSCLQVFRADQHLVGGGVPPSAADSLAPTPAPAPKPKPKPKPKSRSGFDQDESWALELLGEDNAAHFDDDDELDALEAKLRKPLSNPVAPAPAPAPVGSPSRNFNPNATGTWSAGNNTHIRLDDELSDLLASGGDGHLTSDKPEDAVHVINSAADESWAQSILSELREEDKKADSKKYGMQIVRDDLAPKAGPRNAKLAAALGEISGDEQPSVIHTGKPTPPPPQSVKPSGPRPAPRDDELSFDSDEDALDLFNDESLGLGSAPPPPPPGHNPFGHLNPLMHSDEPKPPRPAPPVHHEPTAKMDVKALIGWSLSCAVCLLLLMVQAVYFNFDRWAAGSERPMLELLFKPFGIRLPPLPDISRFEVQNLTVRPDSDVSGVLVIDALLDNDADFTQPFPALRISFTDSNDHLIAGRVFQPADYLAGQARDLRRIPPDTPVHFSLRVVKPEGSVESDHYKVEPRYN